MQDSVKERLIKFLESERISKSEFGRAIGVSSAYVTSIKNSVSPEKLQAIALKFPKLNIQWLLTGEGEMVNSVNNSSGVVINGNNKMSNSSIDNRHYYSDSPDVLRAQIEILDERIKEKDAQIKEKDAQIKQLLDILSKLR